MEKLYLHFSQTMTQAERDKMETEINAMLSAAYQVGQANEREACAVVAESWADHYPTDVFPEESTSVDAISARAMRHAAQKIAAAIRARGDYSMSHNRDCETRREND